MPPRCVHFAIYLHKPQYRATLCHDSITTRNTASSGRTHQPGRHIPSPHKQPRYCDQLSIILLQQLTLQSSDKLLFSISSSAISARLHNQPQDPQQKASICVKKSALATLNRDMICKYAPTQEKSQHVQFSDRKKTTAATFRQPITAFVNDVHKPTSSRYKAPRTCLIFRKEVPASNFNLKFSSHSTVPIFTLISLQHEQRRNKQKIAISDSRSAIHATILHWFAQQASKSR